MQLAQDIPEGRDWVRSVAPDRIVLASGERRRSFVIAPAVEAFDWPVTQAASMTPTDCDALIALQPNVVILGTGTRQIFPPRDVLAAFLTRRIGVECMDNAAAARTYNVLMGEGRQVLAAFIVP